MSTGPGLHDRALLDALLARAPEPFEGEVWRVTREGVPPLRGSRAGGRWSPPGAFEVLYTSLSSVGALAEIGFRLSREPVWPSRMRHTLHRIAVRTERSLRIDTMDALAACGVDTGRYTSFDYTATQAIASATQFLEFDSLIVPSARSPATHLVVFLEPAPADGALTALDSTPVDWDDWRRARVPAIPPRPDSL